MDIRENSEIRQKRRFGRDMLCLDKGCKIADQQCKSCSHFGGMYNDSAIICNLKDDMETTNSICWRKCKAGYKFPSDAIVIPDDDRTTDRDPRLVRCAVWDSKYIMVDDLKKLPVNNE